MSTSETASQSAGDSDAVGKPPGAEGLYVRKTSGLVRELGIRDAFGVNIAAVSPSFGLAVFFIAIALFPGTDMTVPLLIAGAFGVLLVFCYAQLLSCMPRSGGDYIFTSRVFNPIVGAAVGGAVFIAFSLGGSTPSIFWGTQFFPFLLQCIGGAFSWHAPVHWATEIAASKNATFLSAVALMFVLMLLATRSTRVITRVIFWGFFLSMIGMFVLAGLFLFASNSHFVHSYNAAAGVPNAYSKVIASARSAGFHTGISTAAVIAAIPFAVTAASGFTLAVYPGGEVKRPGKNFRIAALAALGASVALMLMVWLTMRHTAGLHFVQSTAWLSTNDAAAYGKDTAVPAFGPFYGLVLSGDPVTKLLLGFGFAAGEVAILLADILIISRLLFGMSFDRVLPSWVASVRPRSHAPVNAAVIVTASIIGFSALGIYTNYLSTGRNTVLISAGVFAIGSLAAAVLPYRRRDLYAASPQLFGKWGRVPVITVVGAVSAAFNLYVLYLVAVKPQLSGGYDAGSIITLISVVLLGVVAYTVSRVFLRSRGIDMSLAMRELPPD